MEICTEQQTVLNVVCFRTLVGDDVSSLQNIGVRAAGQCAAVAVGAQQPLTKRSLPLASHNLPSGATSGIFQAVRLKQTFALCRAPFLLDQLSHCLGERSDRAWPKPVRRPAAAMCEVVDRPGGACSVRRDDLPMAGLQSRHDLRGTCNMLVQVTLEPPLAPNEANLGPSC